MQTPVAPLSTSESPAAQLDGNDADTQLDTNADDDSAVNADDSIAEEMDEASEESSVSGEDADPIGTGGQLKAGQLDKS